MILWGRECPLDGWRHILVGMACSDLVCQSAVDDRYEMEVAAAYN